MKATRHCSRAMARSFDGAARSSGRRPAFQASRNRLCDRLVRRGISLVEMLVVIAIAAAMVGLTVTTIHRLLGAERDATRAARNAASVSRLARDFRDDLHAARDVEWPAVDAGKPASLVAVLEGGRRVLYEIDAHRVTRLETYGAEGQQREAYYFPPQSRLAFEPAAERGLVRLSIDMPARTAAASSKNSSGANRPAHHLTIEAAVIGNKPDGG